MFVSFHDEWWVRISIITQHANICVIILQLLETFLDFGCLAHNLCHPHPLVFLAPSHFFVAMIIGAMYGGFRCYI